MNLRNTLRCSNRQIKRGDTLEKIDLEALERWKEKNRRERLQFVEDYANWLKKTPNKEWSKQQAELSK